MKFNELGRSMVEMLGVLAIIGVLSVGAISGYSKAMMKYKLNKQAESIVQLINAGILIHETVSRNNPSSFNFSLFPYYQKLNYLPENIKKIGNTYYDIFKNQVINLYAGSQNTGWETMQIQIQFVSSAASFTECVNIFQTTKTISNLISYMSVSKRYSDSTSTNGVAIWGNDSYAQSNKSPKPYILDDLTIDDMYVLCDSCKGSSLCSFNILYNYRVY